MECLSLHRLAFSRVEKSYYIPEIFGFADSPSASVVLLLLCIPHGPNCVCALCSARRGDCYFCIICTLPQGECDICREC